MFPAEVRIHNNDDLTAKMAAMRRWLDHHRFEPSAFRYRFASLGIVLHVDFSVEAEAAAFAKEFGGRVISKISSPEAVD